MERRADSSLTSATERNASFFRQVRTVGQDFIAHLAQQRPTLLRRSQERWRLRYEIIHLRLM
jgi:hypothetical protein